MSLHSQWRQPLYCAKGVHAPLKRHASAAQSPRMTQLLEEYVNKEARPISLRQLTFFGRILTEQRLLGFANYVRTELPIRLAHRIRDMQKLPYVVVTNPNMSQVYELYYNAFEKLSSIPQVNTLADNNRFCETVKQNLQEHLTIIPSLGTAVLECRNTVQPEVIDQFMNSMLRSRISRRVIAEQHLALSESFSRGSQTSKERPRAASRVPEFVGDVFLRCEAQKVVEECGNLMRKLLQQAYGKDAIMPEIVIRGHMDASFPYIPSHLEYVVGELLRNSLQATIERHLSKGEPLHPVEVLICEAPHHIILRFSDHGGGISRDLLPYIWSFSKGPRSEMRLQNLSQVPQMAATLQELKMKADEHIDLANTAATDSKSASLRKSSLASLAVRPPNLRLGMGLPMSRVYAEYWAGSLELQSLEGYGVDAFLQISKLGNQSEQFDYKSEFGMHLDY